MKIINIERWLLSSNVSDIGVLYLVFTLFSVFLGVFFQELWEVVAYIAYPYLVNLFCSEYWLTLVTPVISYINVEKEKSRIIKENKGKSGIYRWINKLNGKIYVGSSADLGRRFSEYFRPSWWSKNMVVYKAISKYGISNFDFDILEYADKENIEIIEQSYIDELKPDYNLSPTAGSNLGYKWTEEQIAKKQAYYKTEAGLIHLSKVFRKEGKWSEVRRAACPVSVKLKVTEISTGVVSEYASIRLAAEVLGVTQQAISKRLKLSNTFVLRDTYLIEKIINS